MEFNIKFAVTAILLSAISVLGSPIALNVGIAERAAPNAFAMATLSSLFGWQLAGSQMKAVGSWASCSDMSHKWTTIGLDTDYIKAALCNSSASHHAADVVPYTVIYTTDLFIMQLLGSFDNVQGPAYICEHIGFNMVSSFALNDLAVVDAVCKAGGVQTKPRPETSMPWASANAVQAARNTASILFASIWATGATSKSQLTAMCSRAPDYVSYLNKEQLNGTLIQSTICSIDSPIPVGDARNSIKTWTTRYFITVVENISHDKGWLEWLCGNIDPGLLTFYGLYGPGVQSQICSDSQNFPNNNVS